MAAALESRSPRVVRRAQNFMVVRCKSCISRRFGNRWAADPAQEAAALFDTLSSLLICFFQVAAVLSLRISFISFVMNMGERAG
jgi:hypothetical protein